MLETFWDVEKGRIGNYPIKPGRVPKVTSENFLEQLRWVSWRTSANFDMPCAYCGTFNKVQMHHIKHVRKRAYSLIPQPENYKQIMALRNRKQIPLCETHHRYFVHGGNYSGVSLIKLAPRSQGLLDNRILHLESFIKIGQEYHAKTLIEKSWKTV